MSFSLQGRIWGTLILVIIGFLPVLFTLFDKGSSKSDKIFWISFFVLLVAVILFFYFW